MCPSASTAPAAHSARAAHTQAHARGASRPSRRWRAQNHTWCGLYLSRNRFRKFHTPAGIS
eukprot:2776901-Prymnesium_polylepis.1